MFVRYSVNEQDPGHHGKRLFASRASPEGPTTYLASTSSRLGKNVLYQRGVLLRGLWHDKAEALMSQSVIMQSSSPMRALYHLTVHVLQARLSLKDGSCLSLTLISCHTMSS